MSECCCDPCDPNRAPECDYCVAQRGADPATVAIAAAIRERDLIAAERALHEAARAYANEPDGTPVSLLALLRAAKEYGRVCRSEKPWTEGAVYPELSASFPVPVDRPDAP